MDGSGGGLRASRDHAGWVDGAGGPCKASRGHIGPEGPPGATSPSLVVCRAGGTTRRGQPLGVVAPGVPQPPGAGAGRWGGFGGVQGGRGQGEEWGREHPGGRARPAPGATLLPPAPGSPKAVVCPQIIPSQRGGSVRALCSPLLGSLGHRDSGRGPIPIPLGCPAPGELQPRSREPPSTPSPPPHKCSPHPPHGIPAHPAGPHSPVFGVSLPGGAWGGSQTLPTSGCRGAPSPRPHHQPHGDTGVAPAA